MTQITTIPVPGSIKIGRRLHRMRRLVQTATIILALIIPISGLFRIDPVEGAFVVLDRQVWFADFHIVIGLWLAISSLLVVTYSFVGTAFCGWSCPQNTLSEWANLMTHKWLGKRAEVSLDASPLQVSAGKNKWLNWIILGTLFIVVSLASALVPLLYFYPPDVIASFITFRDDPRLAPSLYWIYTIFALIMLLNISCIRHFWCRFMCVYRVWQHSFKTRETLRVVHDKHQTDECAHCNFCVSNCIVEIDPRQTATYDSCINCGECITACEQIRGSRKTGASLLHFEVGAEHKDQRIRDGKNVGTILSRAPWALLLAGFGLAMFGWGVNHYQPHHMTVYRAETLQGDTLVDYRINVANKLYRPARLTIQIEGLPVEDYQLAHDEVIFSSTGRQDVALRLSEDLAHGLHPFIVRLTADDGWQRHFKVQHFSSGGRHEPQT